METSIGEVLHFNEGAFIGAKNNIEQEIIPLVKNLNDVYNKLEIESFNQDIYTELMGYGITGTKNKFLEIAENDLKKFASPLLGKSNLNNVDEYLEPLSEAIGQIKDAFLSVNVLTRPYLSLVHDVIEINKRGPKLNAEVLQTKFEIRFTTNKQIELYKFLDSAAHAVNTAIKEIKANSLPVPHTGIIGAYLQYDSTNLLKVNNSIFHSIK